MYPYTRAQKNAYKANTSPYAHGKRKARIRLKELPTQAQQGSHGSGDGSVDGSGDGSGDKPLHARAKRKGPTMGGLESVKETWQYKQR